MENETWQSVLGRLDSSMKGLDVIRYEEFPHYPRGAKGQLLNLGLLQSIQPSETITCDECEQGCFIEPVWHNLPTGRKGYYVCNRNDEMGGFFLEPEQFSRWRFDIKRLAELIAESIGTKGQVVIDVRERVFFLGHIKHEAAKRDVFLARGMAWPDAKQIIAQATRFNVSPHPIVITMQSLPTEHIWDHKKPSFCSLAETGVFTDDQLQIDLSGMYHPPTANAKASITLTQTERDILEAMSENPQTTMLQVEIIAAAGYGRSATKDALNRLQKTELVAKPGGTVRKGLALTEEGQAQLNACIEKQ